MSVPTKLLSVRLPESERRRIKALAASQGLTLGEAIRAAFDAWASQLRGQGAVLPGALAIALSGDGTEPPAAAPRPKPGRPPRAAKPRSG